jgi:hypothetical protein
MQHCFDMRERGTAINEVVSNKSMLTRNASDGTPLMNLSNKADDDKDIFASVGEYDGDGADADAEECTDAISTKQTIPTKVSLFLGGNVESNGVTLVEASLPVHSSRSLVVKGLTLVGPLGFDDDDGIGLDFDGQEYDDKEEDNDVHKHKKNV